MARRWVVPLLAALLLGGSLAGCGSSRTLIKVEPEIRHRIVLDALGQVGRPYRYGGTTPQGFDCSGLVQYVFAQSGIRIPRTTLEQRAIGVEIDEDDLLPGDLLFYRFGNGGRVDHVALYLGDGEAIHAPASGRSIIVASVDMKYWRQHFVEAVRIVE